jgi:hypothetical protein
MYQHVSEHACDRCAGLTWKSLRAAAGISVSGPTAALRSSSDSKSDGMPEKSAILRAYCQAVPARRNRTGNPGHREMLVRPGDNGKSFVIGVYWCAFGWVL